MSRGLPSTTRWRETSLPQAPGHDGDPSRDSSTVPGWSRTRTSAHARGGCGPGLCANCKTESRMGPADVDARLVSDPCSIGGPVSATVRGPDWGTVQARATVMLMTQWFLPLARS